MSLFNFVLYVVSTLGAIYVSIAKAEEKSETQWKTIQVPVSQQNLQVPREFWDFVKQALKDNGATETQIKDFSIQPITVEVDLYSDSAKVLNGETNYQILYGEGGGTLDFFDYIGGRGSFRLRFLPQLPDDSSVHLFYISDSPSKEVAGDLWGNECGRIYNLTAKASEFLVNPGTLLTSSRKHYMYLMAGTFIFFQLVDEKLYLGYIRLTDSRYPQFSCRNN